MSAVNNKSGVLKWGILGCGKISNDFCNAVHQAAGSVIQNVGARSESSAEAFGKTHGAIRFGTYESVVSDPEVEVVYVGAINTQHYKLALSALEKGKHVLCEKPMGMNAGEVRNLMAKAKEKNLFLMEGVWTRCFPATRKIADHLSSGALGPVVTFQGDLGFDIPVSIKRLYDLNLGAG